MLFRGLFWACVALPYLALRVSTQGCRGTEFPQRSERFGSTAAGGTFARGRGGRREHAGGGRAGAGPGSEAPVLLAAGVQFALPERRGLARFRYLAAEEPSLSRAPRGIALQVQDPCLGFV